MCYQFRTKHSGECNVKYDDEKSWPEIGNKWGTEGKMGEREKEKRAHHRTIGRHRENTIGIIAAATVGADGIARSLKMPRLLSRWGASVVSSRERRVVSEGVGRRNQCFRLSLLRELRYYFFRSAKVEYFDEASDSVNR